MTLADVADDGLIDEAKKRDQIAEVLVKLAAHVARYRTRRGLITCRTSRRLRNHESLWVPDTRPRL